MKWTANWIASARDFGEVCPVFEKRFQVGKVKRATLYITAMGVYEATLNGRRVGEFLMAPGWTVYEKRQQYQSYDVTALLKPNQENLLRVTVAAGWFDPRLGWDYHRPATDAPRSLIAQLELEAIDSSRTQILTTDETWRVAPGKLTFCSLYDGECYDARRPLRFEKVTVQKLPKRQLIPQEGEPVRALERLKPVRYFTTPAGERVLDFGQNLTGFVSFTVTASAGQRVELSHAEVLDHDGNFYTDNYRSAKAKLEYRCKSGKQTYTPSLTFYGFRYVRIDSFPGEINPDDFTAVAVHSDLKRTGWLSCSNPLLNRLFENIVWGQKGNFLDIPTDCPQRDERLGWTGDAQVFVRTACYQFDVERFFRKWLRDLAADQEPLGRVPAVVPNTIHPFSGGHFAWGDAATIVPWQIYLSYGDKSVLKEQFESMRRWVDYITSVTTTPFLWTGDKDAYGDWLALDNDQDSWKGSSDFDLLASAFYANSTLLVTKAGRVLKKDVAAYEALYRGIVKRFKETFQNFHTQTECAVALYFGLAKEPQKVADQLARLVEENGKKLTTGFVGTPYLLHALSRNGHTDIAYDLLLQEDYPSWLYSVRQGATTVWEHWDGLKDDGSFWSAEMNSFNHYAYGSVADWVFGVAAGIEPVECEPGYARVHIAPHPDERLGWLEARVNTKYGRIRSKWEQIEGRVRYEIDTPVPATIVIADRTYEVGPGQYLF